MKKEIYKGKYYGTQKIERVKLLNDETYLGKQRVGILFEGDKDSSIELPLDVFKQAISKEPKDLTELTEARVKPVVEKIIEIMAEAEMTISEINYLMPLIDSSINENIKTANEKLWGKKNEDKNLLDVDKILRPEKYEKN